MDAYLINETGVRRVSMKITVYSADRERGREEFRKALMNTSLDNAARRVYHELTAAGVRLRSGPSANSQVRRTIRQGTYVKVKNRTADAEWCQIRMPEGREGWVSCNYLRPIAQTSNGEDDSTQVYPKPLPVTVRVDTTPEETLSRLANDLRAGDIEAAVLAFGSSVVNREILSTLNLESRNRLASAFREAQLLEATDRLWIYETPALDGSGSRLEFTMALDRDQKEWIIVSW